MAVRCDASGDQLTRTTTLPTSTTNFTAMCWAYLAVDTGSNFQNILSFGDASKFYGIGLGRITSTVRLAFYNGLVLGNGTTTAVAVASWVHLAYSVSGTGAGGMVMYVNGVQETTTQANATAPVSSFVVGQSQGGDTYNGRAAAVKLYNGILTADEIKAEMRAYVPLRATGLVSWHPMLLHTDLAQYGATWTAGGTLATEDGPPIAWTVREPRTWRRAAVAAAVVGPQHTTFLIGQAVPRAVQI